MSGTSLDGIDVALVDLSDKQPKLIATHFQPYPATLKETLLALHQPALNELHLAHITANQLARDYSDAIQSLLKKPVWMRDKFKPSVATGKQYAIDRNTAIPFNSITQLCWQS